MKKNGKTRENNCEYINKMIHNVLSTININKYGLKPYNIEGSHTTFQIRKIPNYPYSQLSDNKGSHVIDTKQIYSISNNKGQDLLKLIKNSLSKKVMQKFHRIESPDKIVDQLNFKYRLVKKRNRRNSNFVKEMQTDFEVQKNCKSLPKIFHKNIQIDYFKSRLKQIQIPDKCFEDSDKYSNNGLNSKKNNPANLEIFKSYNENSNIFSKDDAKPLTIPQKQKQQLQFFNNSFDLFKGFQNFIDLKDKKNFIDSNLTKSIHKMSVCKNECQNLSTKIINLINEFIQLFNIDKESIEISNLLASINCKDLPKSKPEEIKEKIFRILYASINYDNGLYYTTSPASKRSKAYIGDGNNFKLVKRIIKARFK